MALTGTTGFLGSAIHARLLDHGHEALALVRRPAIPSWPADAPVVIGDLQDRDALDRLCEDAEVLIHSASYIGPDVATQSAVNVEGTRTLVASARQAGVRRIVYLSTAGVYAGRLGPGFTEAQTRTAPRSGLSASRLAAEEIVLDAGGSILRPHLVHGRGDRWFLAPLLAAMRHLHAWVAGPDVRLSVIGRSRLAMLATDLALSDAPAGVYHAAEPRPVSLRNIVTPVYHRAGTTLPDTILSPQQALEALVPLGVAPAQIELLTHDSWYNSSKVWRALHDDNRAAGRAIELPEDVSWYGAVLGAPDSGR